MREEPDAPRAGTREELIEAMARAMCESNPKNRAHLAFENHQHGSQKRYRTMARAALSAITASGWACVPVEPTEAILKAAHDAHVAEGCMCYEGAETPALWSAMISAALQAAK